MPKSWFSLDNVTALEMVPVGAKIHVIGVCGVAMGQLAIALSERGFQVSGSDKEFYEPIGGLLAQSKVVTHRGYNASNLPLGVDLVVIGNAVVYENPEVLAVEQQQLPYTLFPKVLAELVIKGRHSIVVAGTHGKSTTTALLAFVLTQLGENPSYFIGGVARDLPRSLNDGAKFSVVEGDEYDSAFFAKLSKFHFYLADTLIVTSIEFDHADIYSSIEAINSEFSKLIRGLNEAAAVVVNIDAANIRAQTKEWAKCLGKRLVTYGQSAETDYRILSRTSTGFKQQVRFARPDGSSDEFSLSISGDYNATNALGVIAALELRGFEYKLIKPALERFRGVKRRQEVLIDSLKLTLIEDFAHHPTAVAATLRGLREAFPTRRIWGVFEPRSNTSRRKVFQQEYVNAFKSVDRVILARVQSRAADGGEELLDVDELAAAISAANSAAVALDDAAAIASYLKAQVEDGDMVVLMSNGSFGGLAKLLVDLFQVGR